MRGCSGNDTERDGGCGEEAALRDAPPLVTGSPCEDISLPRRCISDSSLAPSVSRRLARARCSCNSCASSCRSALSISSQWERGNVQFSGVALQTVTNISRQNGLFGKGKRVYASKVALRPFGGIDRFIPANGLRPVIGKKPHNAGAEFRI
jgi:hypothetical protein